MNRRFALVILAILVISDVVAQSYPSKPVRVVVPYPAGGALDDIGRAVGPRLTELWGQPVIIDNRGGAAGGIGADMVAKSPPDGYTLLLANAGPITINPSLQKNLPYDPVRDFQPIVLMVTSPQVLVVHPQLPVRSLKELVALAKTKPGQLNYGSPGVGTGGHLGMEALQLVSGTKMNHVPYKGVALEFIDLISGQIELMLPGIVGALPHLNSGRIRGLAITSLKPCAKLPSLPPIAETYSGFEATSWMGLFAPNAISNDVLLKIQRDVAKVLSTRALHEHFAQQGAEVVAGGPDELRDFTRKESALYARVIQATGLTPESPTH